MGEIEMGAQRHEISPIRAKVFWRGGVGGNLFSKKGSPPPIIFPVQTDPRTHPLVLPAAALLTGIWLGDLLRPDAVWPLAGASWPGRRRCGGPG